jgi:predicted DNA-binding protein
MSKDEVIAWFSEAPDDDLSHVIRNARRVDESDVAGAAEPTDVSIPLMLTSIRLPVELVRQLDEVASAEGITRSEAIRSAVAAFVRERRGGVTPAEAERALDVLRRVVGEHLNTPREAA